MVSPSRHEALIQSKAICQLLSGLARLRIFRVVKVDRPANQTRIVKAKQIFEGGIPQAYLLSFEKWVNSRIILVWI